MLDKPCKEAVNLLQMGGKKLTILWTCNTGTSKLRVQEVFQNKANRFTDSNFYKLSQNTLKVLRVQLTITNLLNGIKWTAKSKGYAIGLSYLPPHTLIQSHNKAMKSLQHKIQQKACFCELLWLMKSGSPNSKLSTFYVVSFVEPKWNPCQEYPKWQT